MVWDHRSPACVRVQGRFVIQGRLVAIALHSVGPGAARCHDSDACACTCVEVDGSFFHACGRRGQRVLLPGMEVGVVVAGPGCVGGPRRQFPGGFRGVRVRVRVWPQKGFDAVKAFAKICGTVVMALCLDRPDVVRTIGGVGHVVRGGGAAGSWLGGSVRLFTTEWAEGTLEGYAGRERRKNGQSSRWKPLFAKNLVLLTHRRRIFTVRSLPLLVANVELVVCTVPKNGGGTLLPRKRDLIYTGMAHAA